MNPKCSMTTGEVREVRSNGQTATFEWEIPDFSRLPQGYNYSPTLESFDREWGLEIRKAGYGIDFVSLRRCPRTPGTPEAVHFGIQCWTSDAEERGAVREQTFPEKGWWLQSIDPPWTIPASAGITLTCSLRKEDSPRATGFSREILTEEAGCQNDDHPLEDISILLEHFEKLLLSGDGHDVLIKVGDKQFRSHKNILKSRSPVFAAMFGSDMAEGAGGSVTIEDCDPDSFGQFLQFVYCGKADITSVGSALSLYQAGDKYDFPTLKRMCVRFLKSSFSTNTVFEVVSLASRHDEEELLQLAIAYFAENLEEVWCTVEWQRFLLANHIEANEMNLKSLQGKSSLQKE